MGMVLSFGKFWRLPACYQQVEGQVLTYSVEKLGFASGAEIHEEFRLILRAFNSAG